MESCLYYVSVGKARGRCKRRNHMLICHALTKSQTPYFLPEFPKVIYYPKPISLQQCGLTVSLNPTDTAALVPPLKKGRLAGSVGSTLCKSTLFLRKAEPTRLSPLGKRQLLGWSFCHSFSLISKLFSHTVTPFYLSRIYPGAWVLSHSLIRCRISNWLKQAKAGPRGALRNSLLPLLAPHSWIYLHDMGHIKAFCKVVGTLFISPPRPLYPHYFTWPMLSYLGIAIRDYFIQEISRKHGGKCLQSVCGLSLSSCLLSWLLRTAGINTLFHCTVESIYSHLLDTSQDFRSAGVGRHQ